MNIVVNADPQDTITINIVPRKPVSSGQMESLEAVPGLLEAADLESLKDEQNQDYSACEGFDENFMGFKTPMPELGKQLRRQVARLIEDPESYILNYYHFSVIQHTVRKMPVVSAVNIDADPKKRKDHSPRKDNWLRDNRIDMEVQLKNSYYSNTVITILHFLSVIYFLQSYSCYMHSVIIFLQISL